MVLPDTFLGLEPEACAYDSSKVVMVQVPYDHTASYGSGARLGPAAIVSASAQVELWDQELSMEPCTAGIHLLPALEPGNAGPEEMVRLVEQACQGPIADHKFVFTLGGEHTVAVGAARAQAGHHPHLCFLQIDAHLDLRETYQGSPYSHACTARLLLELGPVVQVGIRAACPEELEVVRQQELEPLWAEDIQGLPPARWIQQVVDRLGSDVYVTLDLDGLDPSVIPAIGTPVPGGLGWYDVLALLRAVGQQRRIVGCDLCELAPIPGQHASDFAAALLAYKMIGYFVG